MSALSKLATVAPASIDSIGAASAGDAVRTRVPARKQAGAQRSGQAAWSGPRAKPGGSSPSNRDAAAPFEDPLEGHQEKTAADRAGKDEQDADEDQIESNAEHPSIAESVKGPGLPKQSRLIACLGHEHEPDQQRKFRERHRARVVVLPLTDRLKRDDPMAERQREAQGGKGKTDDETERDTHGLVGCSHVITHSAGDAPARTPSYLARDPPPHRSSHDWNISTFHAS